MRRPPSCETIDATPAASHSRPLLPIASPMPAVRFDSFDLLRAVGALAVLVSHSFALTGRPEPGVPGADTLGGLGVAIFFSISGYLIALSWRRDPRPGAFLVKRSLRIFPALGVAVVLAAFLLGPVVTQLSAKGDFSYGLYIYAFPVQQTLVMLWPAPPIVPYIAVVLAATLAFAVASWHWIERPALGWKARLTGRTRAGHDAAAAAEHAVLEH